MDFLDVLRVLRRQIVVLTLGAILTATAAWGVLTNVKTEYQAQAQYFLLLPVGGPSTEDRTNPLLNLPVGLAFAASLIASEINAKATARSLEDQGYESEYSIALAPSSGPMLTVSVTGTNPQDVVGMRNEILERLDSELSRLQDFRGVPDHLLIGSRTNAVDPQAEVVPGAKRRALLLVAAAGVGFTLVIAFLVDGMRNASSRARPRDGN